MLADPWAEPVRRSSPFQGVTLSSGAPTSPSSDSLHRPWQQLCVGGLT